LAAVDTAKNGLTDAGDHHPTVPEQEAATEFSTTAARNLHGAGRAAVIGCDRFAAGYHVAKLAHERAALAGPIPARIVRAAQFHEFVGQLLAWGLRTESPTFPRCARSSSPLGPSPRRSSTWRSRPELGSGWRKRP